MPTKTTKVRAQLASLAMALPLAQPALAEVNLRSALLEVWPRYVGLRLVRDFASECNAQEAGANQAAFATWQSAVGLSDEIEALLERNIPARELEKLRASERGVLRNTLREKFPNCVTNAQLKTFLTTNAAGGSIKGVSPQSMAAVQNALGKTVAKSPVAVSNGATTQAPIDHSALEGVYMDQVYGVGFGGMTTIDFQSYAVFKDGSICKDIATIAHGRGGKFAAGCGQWTRAGNGFNVRWPNGKTEKLDGETFYRTFPAEKGETLNGQYRTLGGGGNVALGGNAWVMASEMFVFSPDGTFTTERASGGGNTGVATRARSGSGGTYALDRHTIELRFNDGRVMRNGFFFFPAKGVKTRDAIGLGGSVYNLKKK
jgi:hypothetical protein